MRDETDVFRVQDGKLWTWNGRNWQELKGGVRIINESNAITAASRPGKRTTEFYLMLAAALATILGVVAGYLPGEWGAVALAVESAVYAFLRTWTKKTGNPNAQLRQEIQAALAAHARTGTNGERVCQHHASPGGGDTNGRAAD